MYSFCKQKEFGGNLQFDRNVWYFLLLQITFIFEYIIKLCYLYTRLCVCVYICMDKSICVCMCHKYSN